MTTINFDKTETVGEEQSQYRSITSCCMDERFESLCYPMLTDYVMQIGGAVPPVKLFPAEVGHFRIQKTEVQRRGVGNH